MKKRVLFICKGHKNIAGAQLYLQKVSKVFPPDAYELHYAFQAKDGTRVFDEIEKERDLGRWEYDWRHLPFFASYRQARRLYKKVNPDYVLLNSSEDEIIPPLLAARAGGIKNRIMAAHWAQTEDSLPWFVRKNRLPFPIPSRYSLKTRVKRSLAYSFLNKMIFVNDGTRRAYVKLYRVAPAKCRTIYNGVDANVFRCGDGSRRKIRTELGVAENETVVLSTGNLVPIKGHEVLIAAIANLVAQGRAVKCFIAGQGELREKLESWIARNGLSEYCKLLGFRNDIPQLISAADIFCMPSLNEALSYSLIEALAAGRPTVASRVGGIPEVVTDGVEGLLVPPGSAADLSSAIDKLLESRSLRLEMGANGARKAVEKFSLESMVKLTAVFLGVDGLPLESPGQA